MSIQTSRTKSAILNMIFNFLYQIINTIVNIVLPPLIIGQFGSITNGLISTIKQILGYVQLVGAGISESTVVSLYKPLAEKNEKKISAIFNACSTTFFKMGIIFNISSVVLAILYPLFIESDINYGYLSILILILSIAGASEFYVIGKCRSLLVADQKIYVVNIAQIFGALANLIITILLIKNNVSILVVQLGASVVYAMRLIIVYTYVKKNYLFLDKTVSPNYKAIEKRKDATIHQLAGLISFGSQTIIVSMVCGLAEASVYSVYNLVFTGINTILSTISSALLATFGHIIANDNREKLKKLYSLYETFYFILVFVLYSITYIMFLSFISIYTSGVEDAVYYRPEYAILFCVMGIVNCLRTPGATLINAIGHYGETKNRAIIEMVICFVLEIILVNLIGATGVLIATILAYLYRTIDVLHYSNKVILYQSPRNTIIKLMINIIIYVLVVYLSTYITINPSTYFEWGIVSLKVSLIIFPMYLSVNFINSKQEYYSLVKRFMN